MTASRAPSTEPPSTWYLDNAATTPVFPQTLAHARPLLEGDFANPSGLYASALAARGQLKAAREALARQWGVPPQGVVFTSGGSEANNLLLRGAMASPTLRGERVVISALEHPSVGETAQAMASQHPASQAPPSQPTLSQHPLSQALAGWGPRVSVVPVTREGVIDLAALENLLAPDVRVVSVMAVSNELGTLQPLAAVGKLVRRLAPKAVFHVDAVQAFTKMALPLKEATIDALSISGHKAHGPKGAGALVMTRPLALIPQITGGGQEDGWRSGTENVFAQVAMAHAAGLSARLHADQRPWRAEYHRRWLDFLADQPRVRVFRSPHQTPFVVRLCLPGIPAEVSLHHLEAEGVVVSTGSACHSRRPEPAAALLAAGFTEAEALSSIRLSFSVHNTLGELPECQAAFARALQKLAKI